MYNKKWNFVKQKITGYQKVNYPVNFMVFENIYNNPD